MAYEQTITVLTLELEKAKAVVAALEEALEVLVAFEKAGGNQSIAKHASRTVELKEEPVVEPLPFADAGVIEQRKHPASCDYVSTGNKDDCSFGLYPKVERMEIPDMSQHSTNELVIAVGKTLPEHFQSSDLMRHSTITKSNASRICLSWKTMKWTTSPRWGFYQRTAKFGLVTRRKNFKPLKPNPLDSLPVGPSPVKAKTPTLEELYPPVKKTQPLEDIKVPEREPNVLVTSLNSEGIKIGLSLLEPFSATDMMARLDENHQLAYRWLADWNSRGWIERCGAFQYRRSKTFGQSK